MAAPAPRAAMSAHAPTAATRPSSIRMPWSARAGAPVPSISRPARIRVRAGRRRGLLRHQREGCQERRARAAGRGGAWGDPLWEGRGWTGREDAATLAVMQVTRWSLVVGFLRLRAPRRGAGAGVRRADDRLRPVLRVGAECGAVELWHGAPDRAGRARRHPGGPRAAGQRRARRRGVVRFARGVSRRPRGPESFRTRRASSAGGTVARLDPWGDYLAEVSPFVPAAIREVFDFARRPAPLLPAVAPRGRSRRGGSGRTARG